MTPARRRQAKNRISAILFISAQLLSPASLRAQDDARADRASARAQAESASRPPTVAIGSKAFTEGFVLAEYAAQILEASRAARVERRFGLGGTGILVQALQKGEIDAYPEYAGTIAESILHDPNLREIDEIRAKLKKIGLAISAPLGFSNSYAIALRKEFASPRRLQTLSDLAQGPASEAKAAFSHEFLTRPDGFSGLREAYGLRFAAEPRAMEHALAYRAIEAGEADAIDVYSTDAKIESLQLTVLQDDRRFFPDYPAVILARSDLETRAPKAWQALKSMEGHFSEAKMRRLNGEVDLHRKSPAEAVALDRGDAQAATPSELSPANVLRRTREHLKLVGLALAFSVAAGVPLGVLARRRPRLSQAILLLSGTAQTIPSLALLCFFIPLFGIGLKPALAALCIYGLLPVVLNTFTGLRSIDARLLDAARSLDLGDWDRFRLIELPLASASILTGVRTSAISGIGTATLAALVGGGGYGAPILSGLAVNDVRVILVGALPAAAMAIAAHALFEAIERVLIPKPLRSDD